MEIEQTRTHALGGGDTRSHTHTHTYTHTRTHSDTHADTQTHIGEHDVDLSRMWWMWFATETIIIIIG